MNKAIEEIYKNRQEFILLGLTGKIGSGCTTTAKFLSGSLKVHALHPLEFSCDSKDVDRKEIIIDKFYKKKWHNFINITMSDAMTYLMLQEGYSSFVGMLEEVFIEQIVYQSINDEFSGKKILNKKDINALFYLFTETYLKYKITKKIDLRFRNNIKKLQKYLGKSERKEFISKIFEKLKTEKLEQYFKINPEFKAEYTKLHKEVLRIKSSISSFETDKNCLKKAYEFINSSEIDAQSNLKNVSKVLKVFLQKISYRDYTKIYQKLGDNLRKYGQIQYCEVVKAENIYTISQTVNTFIKVIRNMHKACNQDSGKTKKTYVVIDSFRNPIEVMFFKERYSAFYLMAINTPDADIHSRLVNNLDLSTSQIDRQSKKENPEDFLNDYNHFISQNVRDCIQKSDIHIANHGDANNNNYVDLSRQLIKYVSLIMHPGLITPSEDEKMMQVAFTAKLNSGCLSRQVGAAVTNKDGTLVSIGWNSVAEGQTPCILRNKDELLNGSVSTAYSIYEKSDEFKSILIKHSSKATETSTDSGLNSSFCFKSLYNKHKDDKNQVHTRSLHAEENAFLQIAKYGGEPIKGGTLYSTASPCELCSKKAYQLGIKRVVFVDPYPGIAQEQILLSGNFPPILSLFCGVIGSSYHRLYEQILPFKDELDAVSGDSCCG